LVSITTAPVPVTLELDDFTIFNMVQNLQGYSLVNTTGNIQGTDIKGVVYEKMVGKTFRGDLAQFFTPRELVDFIVECIRPTRNSKVLDPACGSGGFLIMTLKKLRKWIKEENPNLNETEISTNVKYFADHNLFGIDINDRMVRIAKMNNIMHGDGHSGIFHILRGGGLLTDSNLPQKLSDEIHDGSVDIIFSNPPFAGREKDPSILEKFELGKNVLGKPISVSREILFIEKIIKSLSKNGRAGLVLPSGIFNNKSLRFVRDYIKHNCKITALIALPEAAFIVSGAHNEGSLLFLERTDEIPDDYEIFIDWAENVGFDATGRVYPTNDLDAILGRFRKPSKQNVIRFSELEDRIDPWYYHPTYDKIEQKISSSSAPKLPITKVVTKSTDLINCNRDPLETVRYIETNDVDLLSGRIIRWQTKLYKELPNRATYVLKDGDILIPNHRHSIRGVATVTKSDEGIICTNRFFVVKPDLDLVRSRFLVSVLRQPEILLLMIRQSTGEINPSLNWWGLERIAIPVPNLETQDSILNTMKDREDDLERLITEMRNRRIGLDQEFRKWISFDWKIHPSKKLGSEQICEVQLNMP
jgi:type I restriction enzyme M protein